MCVLNNLFFFVSGSDKCTWRYHAREDPRRTSSPNSDHTTLTLTDYFLGDDVIPPGDANCYGLLVQSGDPDTEHDHFKFSKIISREDLFMPLWSLDELKSLNKALPVPSAPPEHLFQVSDQNLESRFYHWGGCVRSVFTTSESCTNEGIQVLLDKVSSISALDEAIGKTRSNPRVLGRLIHMDVDPENFQVKVFFFQKTLFYSLTCPSS